MAVKTMLGILAWAGVNNENLMVLNRRSPSDLGFDQLVDSPSGFEADLVTSTVDAMDL